MIDEYRGPRLRVEEAKSAYKITGIKPMARSREELPGQLGFMF